MKQFIKWGLVSLSLFIGYHSFASPLEIIRTNSWYGSTVFNFDRVVDGAIRAVYQPFAITLKDKIFAFLDAQEHCLYLAHEYFWDAGMSTVTLYEADGSGFRKMGVIQDVYKPAAGHWVEILDTDGDLIAQGTKDTFVDHGNEFPMIFFFRDREKEAIASGRANPITHGYSIDVDDEKVISPLLIASYFIFEEHKWIRRKDVAIASAVGGLFLVNYFFGKRISQWFFSKKPTVDDETGAKRPNPQNAKDPTPKGRTPQNGIRNSVSRILTAFANFLRPYQREEPNIRDIHPTYPIDQYGIGNNEENLDDYDSLAIEGENFFHTLKTVMRTPYHPHEQQPGIDIGNPYPYGREMKNYDFTYYERGEANINENKEDSNNSDYP